jgi:hypothetical protein
MAPLPIYLPISIYLTISVILTFKTEVEFLDVIGTKLLGVFLLDIHSPLY